MEEYLLRGDVSFLLKKNFFQLFLLASTVEIIRGGDHAGKEGFHISLLYILKEPDKFLIVFYFYRFLTFLYGQDSCETAEKGALQEGE
jgi:hypothetical protein